MELNFIPNYSYKIKIVGLFILIISLLYILFSQMFSFTLIDNEIITWSIAFSLLVITFSQDKRQSENIVLIKYYSGKISSSFIFSFVLSLKLSEIILNKSFSINSIILIIITLSMYQISYNIIRYIDKKNNISIKETGVLETFKNNKKLHFISLILAILTLSLILIFK
jgi:hypothetical protein